MSKFVSLNVRISRKENDSDENVIAFEDILVNTDVVASVAKVAGSKSTVIKFIGGDVAVCNEEFDAVRKKLK
jgi:hypothetical protein